MRELTERLISENEPVFRKERLPKTDQALTDRRIASLFAEKFFSNDYIKQVRDIVLNGCFPDCVNETKFRIMRLINGEHPLQTVLLVMYAQVKRDYRKAIDTGSLEAKEKFQKGAKFVHLFCLADKIVKNKGYIKPNLRERVHKDIRSMLRGIEKQ